ncbi:MAG: hypothetical protein KDI98_08450 [Hyphomicrobiaceae bacterium]|nr:hypothetical protein [Hyphomicrobiaceae bacterium]
MSGRDEPPRQLSLDLAPRTSFARLDYILARSNTEAFDAATDTAVATPVVCVGPRASGKTHLAHIFAEERHGKVVEAGAPEDWPDDAAALAIDNLHALDFSQEDAFFHRLNREIVEARPLFLTSEVAPERRAWRRPDILSRLRAARRVEIGPPDETLVLALLVKGLSDRQVIVDPTALQFLAKRIARDHGEIAALVDALDVMSAERRRRITRGMASEALSLREVTRGGDLS